MGTGAGSPTRQRNVSALALTLPERGEWWMVDCGEGTQHQILRAAHLRLSQMTRVFITHLHGDHFFGLMGLLASRALAQGGASPVTVYGPAALEQWVRTSLKVGQMRFGFPVEIVPSVPGVLFEDDDIIASCVPVRHRMESYAYSVEEKPRPGRFDADAARALGVPFGPLFGQLKAGQTITLPDGTVISPDGLTGPPRTGRKVVVSGDTGYAPDLAVFAQNADVLVHEATYANAEAVLADRAAHSTAGIAAQVAREAHVRRLILTHFSARYDGESGPQFADLLADARDGFSETLAAHDFMRVAVPRKGEEVALLSEAPLPPNSGGF